MMKRPVSLKMVLIQAHHSRTYLQVIPAAFVIHQKKGLLLLKKRQLGCYSPCNSSWVLKFRKQCFFPSESGIA